MTAELSWSELTTTDAPWLYFVSCRERDVDNFARTAPPAPDLAVRFVRGARTAKRDGLLQEWAAAFQFPYYFGGTWDAFEECLNDLDWLPASAYIALVTNFDRVLADDLTELTTFAGVLEMAAKEWTRPERHQDPHPPVPFRVVLHSKPANESLSVERFRIAGMEPAFRGLQRLPNDFDEPES